MPAGGLKLYIVCPPPELPLGSRRSLFAHRLLYLQPRRVSPIFYRSVEVRLRWFISNSRERRATSQPGWVHDVQKIRIVQNHTQPRWGSFVCRLFLVLVAGVGAPRATLWRP